MCRRLLLLFALVPIAFAQNTQVGAMIGRGGIAQLFENSAYHVVTGVEGCFWCGGHFGVFVEYHHWAKTGVGTDQPVSLDLAGGGVRIQGKGRRVRPFFDAGIFGGAEKKDRNIIPFDLTSHAVAAGALGFGAAISITEHWYVRPMARIVVLSSAEFGGFAGAGVGYRF